MRFRRRAAGARKFTSPLTCSFCGKHQRQVDKLIAGPGIYICNECVDLCVEIIARKDSSPSAEPWQRSPTHRSLCIQRGPGRTFSR
jgi:hypothetical protein